MLAGDAAITMGCGGGCGFFYLGARFTLCVSIVSYLYVELGFSLWVMSWGSNFDYAKV